MPKSKQPTVKVRDARGPWLARFIYAHWRLTVSAAAGGIAALLLWATGQPVPTFFVGWDVAVITYLVLVYWMIAFSTPDSIRQHSALQDEGRYAVLILATAAVAICVTLILRWLSGDGIAEDHQGFDLILVFLNVPLAWAFIHTIFTLHYAHEFYAEHRGAGGGLRFPGGGKPDYWDFVYFSFGIGMAAQVADIAVTETRLRRVVTWHSIVSFVFNVTLIALTVSMVGDAVQMSPLAGR